jgi:hypothetical protein
VVLKRYVMLNIVTGEVVLPCCSLDDWICHENRNVMELVPKKE